LGLELLATDASDSEPQQPSDSEATSDHERRHQQHEQMVALQRFAQLVASQEQITAERDAMAAAYHDSCIRGQQANAELQQLREQVATVTQERDRLQSWLQEHHKTGQQSAVKKLERWLRPVLELVAEHPDDASPLAVSVLGYLPGIASRLIEE
jgi:hypothetical protein